MALLTTLKRQKRSIIINPESEFGGRCTFIRFRFPRQLWNGIEPNSIDRPLCTPSLPSLARSPVRIRMSTPKMSNRQIIDGWKEAVSERTDALQSLARSDYSIIPGFVIENPSRFGEVLSSNLTQTMATISSPSVADAMIFQSIGNRLWKHDARFKAALVVFLLTM